MRATATDCRYEELAHTAEVGVRVFAPSREALYVCAATAMFTLLSARPPIADTASRHAVEIQSLDAEGLMVDWLSELLYLHETTGWLMSKCQVTLWTPERLAADVLFCEPREAPSMHIKAVTYHQLLVEQRDDVWCAEVYFDI